MTVWSAAPAAIDALVAAAQSVVTGAAVLDGYGVTNDAGNFLMVGVEDPFASSGYSAEGNQDWAYLGATTRKESGDVWCVAYAWNGDGDQKQARDEATAIVGSVFDAIRADTSLGQGDVLWFSPGTRWSLNQDQDNNGAAALIVFTVHYEAQF